MGSNCCGKDAAPIYENNEINIKELFEPSQLEGVDITEDILKGIMKRIIYTEYETKLKEKRNLQEQRARILRNGLSMDYVKVMRTTKQIEDEIYAEVETVVLDNLKVKIEDFQKAKEEFNIKLITEAAINNLLSEISKSKEKLNLNDEEALKIKGKYTTTYDIQNYYLNNHPELALELEQIYGNNDYFNYLDIVTADALYSDLKLLPIEIQAFID